MQTKECRKIKAHGAHKHLLFSRENMSNVILWCEGRDYALLLAYDVILDSPDNPTDGETCKCHGLVWNFRDLTDGFCPFAQ
jgi:hypothetical protein